MKAFLAALCLLALLIGSVVLLSLAGEGVLQGINDALPAEDTPLTEAAEALAVLSERIDGDRLLLGLLYSHERIDGLLSGVRRTAAAARSGEEGEYALLLAELESTVEGLRRDLRPGLLDLL